MSGHPGPAHPGIPADTLAPLVIGAGATLLLGGILMGPLVSALGIVLIALAIRQWIEILWREGEP